MEWTINLEDAAAATVLGKAQQHDASVRLAGLGDREESVRLREEAQRVRDTNHESAHTLLKAMTDLSSSMKAAFDAKFEIRTCEKTIAENMANEGRQPGYPIIGRDGSVPHDITVIMYTCAERCKALRLNVQPQHARGNRANWLARQLIMYLMCEEALGRLNQFKDDAPVGEPFCFASIIVFGDYFLDEQGKRCRCVEVFSAPKDRGVQCTGIRRRRDGTMDLM